MHNIHNQSAYFVLPKSNLFRRGGETLKYVESEIGHQCGLIMPSSLEKKINKYFGIEYENDVPFKDYFVYLGNITGFKGTNKKSGNTHKSPDCSLFRVGY